ncbi:hypothetical protein [Sinorhizobium meliloti]|uniref:hypothetical protein n=1 Tax=Rhizobium meliloti TaxID=382 RepID=UPI0013E34931|nr:hypothetical protein [Sinorhizobium meliloti]
MPKPYRVVEYDSGPKGMPGMEALINEWAARGYSLHQVVRESTYRWILILSLSMLRKISTTNWRRPPHPSEDGGNKGQQRYDGKLTGGTAWSPGTDSDQGW